MAHIVEDNVRESATTAGAGSFSLGGALTTGRTFSSVMADADTCHYAIHHESLNEWEIGLGTYETTGNLLLRTTPLESSNGGAAVTFSAGNKRVEMVFPGLHALFVRQMTQLTGVVRVDAGVPTVDADVTDIVAAASTTAAGKVELADNAETLTGTDATRAATPDSIAALWEKGADNAGGATITMGDGYQFDLITSTTTITALAFTSDKAGRMALLRFTTARNVTHNATSLISSESRDLAMGAGDFMLVESLGSGNFRIVTIFRSDVVQNLPGITTTTANSAATNATTNLTCGTFTIPANTLRVGSMYRFTAYATFLHTAATTPTLTLELLINAVVVDSAVATFNGTATTYGVMLTGFITCRTTGAGGTVQANCIIVSSGVALASPAGSQSTATDAIDTTVARSIEMRVRMTTAVASNTLTVTQAVIEKVN